MSRNLLIVAFISLFAFLLPYNSDLDARGNQFKGILPPQSQDVSKEEPITQTEEQPLVEATPVTPPLHMIINIPGRNVTLFDDGKEVLRYSIAIGQPVYKTPTGSQTIDTIIWNPWWIPPDSPWARGAKDTPPGPNNPLGPVKMLMGQGIRLHGTNKDSSVGTAASHGCLRMHNEEAVSLAWYIQKRVNGSDESQLEKYRKNRWNSFYVTLNYPLSVDIVYQPVEIREHVVYIYPDVYGWAKNIKTELVNALLKSGINLNKIDEEKLGSLSYPKKRNEYVQVEITELLTGMPEKNKSYAVVETTEEQ